MGSDMGTGVNVAQTTRRLTAKGVEHLRTPGLHHDGDGLYLQIKSDGARSWLYRYRSAGKLRDMGLGSAKTVSLAEARQAAAEARRLRQAGADPILARREARAAEAARAARGVTFAAAAASYIAAHRSGWRNEKHADQWVATLTTYAYPVIGQMSVADVDIAAVLKVLQPIWSTKTETASRLRGRIEAILDWARVGGMRDGDNPARWRGHLEVRLPAPSRVRKVEHHAALPYPELPAFMIALERQAGIGALALRFTILTAARTGEALGMRWAEVDDAAKLWTVPASRMKGGREHRVPLTDEALEILAEMRPLRSDDAALVFPLSNMTMTAVLRRMDRGDLTVHGFRSTFRDWAAEATDFPGEVAEAALAHIVGDKVEAAYRRGDLFEKRRKLMAAWAEYATRPTAAP